jgi:fatty acid kinase fatty acid binding subunit
MGGVRVVTDSTADLGSLAADEGVAVVPLGVSFGDETFEDGVTIDPKTFYARLAHSHVRPMTSQPTPGAFEVCYRKLLSDGAEGIVSIHISAQLSGTYNTAASVARTLRDEGARIEVIDSRQASLSMDFGVQAAAQAARDGAEIGAVAEAARDALERSTIYLVADDLSYLQRGGRIGQARRVVGTLLSVKPIISMRDGAVVSLELPRTRRRAYERLAEYLKEQGPVEALVVGQTSQEHGDELEAMLRRTYSGPLRRAWAGPTIGTHVGPGAAGMAVLWRRKSQ